MGTHILVDRLAEALCREKPDWDAPEAYAQWVNDCRANATVLSLQYSGFDVKEFLARCGL